MVPKFAWKNGFKWNGCFWLVSWSQTYLSECFCGVRGDGPKLRWLIGDYTEFFEDCQLGNVNAGNKRSKLFSSCHYPWNRARRHYFHLTLDRYYFWYWYTFIQSQAEVWLKIWDMEESWIMKAWLLSFCLFCLTKFHYLSLLTWSIPCTEDWPRSYRDPPTASHPVMRLKPLPPHPAEDGFYLTLEYSGDSNIFLMKADSKYLLYLSIIL